ncbi:MAG: tRNA 2-thiouridine(34) synthase MnmA [Gammaproteobacteria bacterium]
MRTGAQTRVIVGLSGGVDSAVAALLLKEQSYAVEGLFMDNWEDGEEQTYCTAAEDFQDARQVCETLDIPLHMVNFAAEYRERVFRHFLDEHAAGRTPNPDVLCNSEIKFKAFLDYALRLGAEFIATGHYARTTNGDAGVKLLRGLDPAKDQSYFLHAVPQTALGHAIFPVGGMLKQDVRQRARAAGFLNHDKKDSTGICFIGERRFSEFLSRYLPAQPGNIETIEGEVLGSHRGLMHYTLGQRQGLGVGGRRATTEMPWYVAAKDLRRNVLVAVQGHDHPLLQQQALVAGQLHWIAGMPPAHQFACTAKARYRQADQACQVTIENENYCHVIFDRIQRALTPGQYVVFYHGEECLGGGVINAVVLASSSAAAAAGVPARSAA